MHSHDITHDADNFGSILFVPESMKQAVRRGIGTVIPLSHFQCSGEMPRLFDFREPKMDRRRNSFVEIF